MSNSSSSTDHLTRPLASWLQMISPKGERRWNHDLVSLKVMAKLSRRNQEHVEQLLRLCITCLSIGQDLSHVIHRSLNRIGLPFFLSLGNEDYADHISGGRVVK
jgi:hypothetical protein